MFKKLKKAFARFIEKASRVIVSREELEEAVEELKITLLENDVAYEVVEYLAEKLVEAIEGKKVRSREELVRYLESIIREIFEASGSLDLEGFIAALDKPVKILFLGVNGVGKTTTIAKLAVYLREKGYRPLMVAADTFRAGAQEQLKLHGERTGIPVFTGKYGSDPAALAYDAIVFAEKRGYDVVLIDTAGRMHTDVDLVDELKKITRVAKPHLKILVVDALTGNDAIEQARFFNDAVGVDAVIVTKADAYEKGGVPLSIAYVLRKPIVFIGTGQEYKDLKPFNLNEFLSNILPSTR